MIFHQQLREFIKAHPDLTKLTEAELEEFETTCSSEENDQRASDQMPALRHQSSHSIEMYEPTANPIDDQRSANAIDFGQSAAIDWHKPTGEPNTSSRGRQSRNRKSASPTDGSSTGKSVHFGDLLPTKKNDTKKTEAPS
jgi:hypothetical protein